MWPVAESETARRKIEAQRLRGANDFARHPVVTWFFPTRPPRED